MREPSYLVLVALAGGRAHGYAVLREVEAISAARVRLQVGSLYAVLERLEGEGLVAVDGEERVAGRLRRYFTLTDGGRSALQAETERLEANVRAARARLAPGRSSTVQP